ncbi:MAG: outer membrane lipid asymmetry maintenance protein MlaD [Burkholderiaceae bacterium]|jgi:phospholipid/cholesterol/gamma-HCH transport system substrate-binding protein|nr:outer membrane lipid asymmetry maintenance protein MlaD [Burkholderiaceae bacterium]MEB2318972.1 outer membrane lipid asymmetry maintenance protein MlaD [Pseudomonadota bacterium]
MNRKTTDTLVGLFVLGGLAAILFLSLKAGNLATFSFADGYQVTARFDNIGGLKARAPVKSAGVVVGRVQSIGFDPKSFRATVRIEIEDRYRFPKDTSASILTSGLLGEQYIGLAPGGDPEDLEADDIITMTQSAVVLESLIGQFLYGRASEGGSQ